MVTLRTCSIRVYDRNWIFQQELGPPVLCSARTHPCMLSLDDIAQGRQGFVDGLGLLHLLARDFALLQPLRASSRATAGIALPHEPQWLPIQCSHGHMVLPQLGLFNE